METIKFQITDIQSDDIIFPESRPSRSGSSWTKRVSKFVITLYGIDIHGNNIVCHALNYHPTFYIRIPDGWDEVMGINMLKDICERGKVSYDNTVKSINLSISTEFYKFYRDLKTGGAKKFKYLKITCKNYGNMRKLIKAIKDVYHDDELRSFPLDGEYRFIEWLELSSDNCESNLYESFVHPILKFIHESNIEPTGWVTATVDDKYLTDLYDIEEYSCDWDNIKEYKTTEISNFLVASFDIECDSSHGDFPYLKKI